MKRGLLRAGWGWKAAAIHILYIKKVRYGERKEFAKDVTAERRICLEVLLYGCLDAFRRQRTRDKRSEWAPHRGMERASPLLAMYIIHSHTVLKGFLACGS